MAEGHSDACAVLHDISTVPSSFITGSITSESRDEYVRESVSPISNKLRIAWAGDFPSLKQLMNKTRKLNGEWSQPGGEKKVFDNGSCSISWLKNKNFCPSKVRM